MTTTNSNDRSQLSIRPSAFRRQQTCAEVEYMIATRVTLSRKIKSLKRHADCHLAHCPKCQSPAAKTKRMLERRGRYDRSEAEQEAFEALRESGCVVCLTYPDREKFRNCLEGLHRSHEQQDGIALYTQDGGMTCVVTAESARFIKERMGEPRAEASLEADTLTGVLDRGYRGLRGWGAHSGAKIFEGKPRSLQSPNLSAPNELSLRVFSGGLDTEEGHRRKGYVLPWDAPKPQPTRPIIDDQPAAVVPSDKITDKDNPMIEQLLKQIAENTAVLPKMRADLARLVALEKRRDRMSREDYERERARAMARVSRWVN